MRGLHFVLYLGLLYAGFAWINVLDTPLPFPAHQFFVVHVDPEQFPQTPRPLEGVFALNAHLRKAHRMFDGVMQSAESVVFAPDGTITLADKFGYLYSAQPSSQVPGAVFPDEYALDATPVQYIGPGRVLAMAYDAQGNLIMCDSTKGLTMMEAGSKRLVILANRVSDSSPLDPGHPITYANALTIGSDGTIFFTASQDIPVFVNLQGFYDTFRSYMLGLFSGDATGRLLAYFPNTGETHVLAKAFWYSNGVTLPRDETFVAVAETSRQRVMRYWLKGPNAGTVDVLIDRLPGFPDGVSLAKDGNFWVALVTPNTPLVKLIRVKALRVILAYLPAWLRPKLPKWGGVVKVSPSGEPLQFLCDPDGSHIAYVSSVDEHHGRLYMGNVNLNYVSYLNLADVPALEGTSRQSDQ